jgi:excisionase family DNA binding protein
MSGAAQPESFVDASATAIADPKGSHAVVTSRPGFIEPFVSASEVAKFLKLSPRSVAKMARDGRLPAYRISGSERMTWRFRLSEIVTYLGDQK